MTDCDSEEFMEAESCSCMRGGDNLSAGGLDVDLEMLPCRGEAVESTGERPASAPGIGRREGDLSTVLCLCGEVEGYLAWLAHPEISSRGVTWVWPSPIAVWRDAECVEGVEVMQTGGCDKELL